MAMNRRNQYLAPIVLSLVLGCTKTALPTIDNQKTPQPATQTPVTALPENPSPTSPVIPGAPVTPTTPTAPVDPTPSNPVTTPSPITLPPSSNPTLNPSTTVPPLTPGAPVSTLIGDKFKFQDVVVKAPAGWKLHQDVAQPNIVILGFTNANDDYFRIYVEKDSSKDFASMFSFKTQTIKPMFSETIGKYQWSRLENKKSGEQSSFVTSAFWMTLNGYSYYGFGRAKDQPTAAQISTLFLSILE